MHTISRLSMQQHTGQPSVRSRIIAAIPGARMDSPGGTFEIPGSERLGRGQNKALFLDRDGVINVEQHYIHSREEFRFQDGIFELCQAAQDLGYVLVVVTNQSGIGRAYFTESEFIELTEWMIHEFAQREIQIARVYYCPYHPIHGVGEYKYDSPDRKPKPGMLLRARADLNLDLSSSILVGDKLSDINAAKAAGIGTKILLRSIVTEANVQEDHYYISESLDDISHKFFSSAF